ncbi:MAG: aldo/keto reductase [Magnetococcales bacterium]|nr:aldo/keto reductase [Magnetococcales bacterium]MBF0115331.1 aldo/keto reductase [Magnetococcales bacterium]
MHRHHSSVMPGILYGTAWKKERTATLVEQALRQGFRGIDTACQPKHYHEPGVGEGIAAAAGAGIGRADLYLQSKFTALQGQDPQRVPYDPQAPLAEQVQQSLQRSLHNLRCDYLDCLLLHSPMPSTAQTLQVWQAMEGLLEQGFVRQLGISNCYDPALLAFLYNSVRVPPRVVQNRFYAATGFDREIRLFCRERQMHYQSFWTLTANPDLLSHPLLVGLAERYHKSPAQILLRYLTQVGVTPLTGTSSQRHMQEDLAIFSFALQGGECDALARLLV